MIDVLVVGGVYREVLRKANSFETRMGGSGLVAAVAVSSLGFSTSLAATIGSNDADEAVAILDAHGIDRTAVEIVPGASGTFLIDRTGDARAPTPSFRAPESPTTISSDPPPGKAVLVFGMPDVDPFRAGFVARWTPRDSLLLWDRQGWLSKTADASAACAVPARSRIYLANVDEAQQEAGGATVAELTGNHPLPGYEHAFLKNGRWGTTLLSRRNSAPSEHIPIPAFEVAPISTIGSGDVFAGVLAARLAGGAEPETAGTEAAAAAALAISRESPLLDANAPDEVAGIIRAARQRYVDPVRLDEISVVVTAASSAATELVADAFVSQLRDLGLRVEEHEPGTGAVDVTLAVRGSNLIARIESGDHSLDMVITHLPDLARLVNTTVESVEKAANR